MPAEYGCAARNLCAIASSLASYSIANCRLSIMTTKLIPLILGCWPVAQVWADPPESLRVICNVQDMESNRTYADASASVNVLGMRAVSGLDEAWLLELHDSFASIEGVDQALASRAVTHSPGGGQSAPDDLLPPARFLIASYRPGLSYRPDEATKNLPKARYLLVSIYRIRLGNEAAFADTIKLRRARIDSLNLDRPEIAYEVLTGAMSGTYVFVAPLPTLKILDDGLAKTPNYAEGLRDAGKKAAADTEMNLERMLFRIEPGMSYVSEEFVSGDPEFWNPKPK
jgi:hypothetical protein